jgi:hypothetical protein
MKLQAKYKTQLLGGICFICLLPQIVFAFDDENYAKTATKSPLIENFNKQLQPQSEDPRYIAFKIDRDALGDDVYAHELIARIKNQLGFNNATINLMIDEQIFELDNLGQNSDLALINAKRFGDVEVFIGEDINNSAQANRIIHLISINEAIPINEAIKEEQEKVQLAQRQEAIEIATNEFAPTLEDFAGVAPIEISANFNLQNGDPNFQQSQNGIITQNGEMETTQISAQTYDEENLGANTILSTSINDTNIELKIDLSQKLAINNYEANNLDNLDNLIGQSLSRTLRTKQNSNILLKIDAPIMGANANLIIENRINRLNSLVRKANHDGTSTNLGYETSETNYSNSNVALNIWQKAKKFGINFERKELNNQSKSGNANAPIMPLLNRVDNTQIVENLAATYFENAWRPNKKVEIGAYFGARAYDFSQSGNYEKNDYGFVATPKIIVRYNPDNNTKIIATAEQQTGNFYYGGASFSSQIINSNNNEDYLSPERTTIAKLGLERKIDNNGALFLVVENRTISDKIGAIGISQNGVIIGQKTGNIKTYSQNSIEARLNYNLHNYLKGAALSSRLRVNQSDNPEFLQSVINGMQQNLQQSFELNLDQKINDNYSWGTYFRANNNYQALNYNAITNYPDVQQLGVYYDFKGENGDMIRAEFNSPINGDYYIYNTQYSGNISSGIVNNINFSQPSAPPKVKLTFRKKI